jgi:flagellar biosynthesis protein FliP
MSKRDKAKPLSPKVIARKEARKEAKRALKDQLLRQSIRDDIDRIVAMIDNTMYSNFDKPVQKKSIPLYLLSKYSL